MTHLVPPARPPKAAPTPPPPPTARKDHPFPAAVADGRVDGGAYGQQETGAALDEIDDLRALLKAARAHRPDEEFGVPMACYNGDCDHDDDCPEVTFMVCRECMRIARQINDEMIPDEAMAMNCVVCVAVMTMGLPT